MLDRSLSELALAGTVDGVLLNLHGAMVAEDDENPELALVNAVRDVLGAVPIACVLDLHANTSPELVDRCDVVISYDTYPHVDMRARGREAASMLVRMISGGERFETSLAKVPLLASPLAQATDEEPMRGLQARAHERAATLGLERACIVGGFAYSDVPRAGTSVLAVHRPERRDAASQFLYDTVRDIEAHESSFRLEREGPVEAVRQAIASKHRPVVLVDVADNVGGGSPGDGTALLEELVRQGATGALVVIADAAAARTAALAGQGKDVVMSVGAKADDRHGQPLVLAGRVVHVGDGRYRAGGAWMDGRTFEMGATAVVEVGANTVVLTERRVPPFHLEQVTSQGIDPASMSIVVVKGAVAWRAAYGQIAREIIEVATPGVCPVDPSSLRRTTTPSRYP